MAGIYLHIPFCRQACAYCNFHFATSLRYKRPMVAALAKEAVIQKPYLQGEPLATIYFGGGTPSLLEGDEILFLLQTIREHYTVLPDAEITLEANPDDITPAKLDAWKSAGINRLSMGVQSFREADLRWMNRAHNSAQALDSIRMAQAAGLYNISIDLIYGTPGLDDAAWKANVAQALALEIPHLSCYALTVEEKTPLHKQIERKQKVDVDNEQQAHQFLLLMQWLKAAGYEHYEVSNFALPGWRSRHNSSYWRGEKYLGLGPSAHSFNGTSRQWNVANNNVYIQSLEGGTVPFEIEVLTPEQQLNEHLMISLRTAEGLNLDVVASRWGQSAAENIQRQVTKFAQRGLLQITGSNIQLTNDGMLRADGIAADLFVD
ncbi:radical SAM family heme chaperone HemW [Paracnuella aquatica]|uniref:radical SAM family heme chaperone HemW n=1 Tax=Paracnuella aquatica TaxID=2268757 RepID=UPI000DEFFC74|nr:radical SAM family heme chaperone HemW [Paracnuella aquatica]RPD45614.1 radical SAM family heme chaperone HemW [Paracnuella aquatica]